MTCPEGSVCGENTGQCESVIVPQVKIEPAINQNVPPLNGMDAIEQAIEKSLS